MPLPLQQVPQNIRNRFGSEATYENLSRIRERVGIGSPRALALLLYKLETKELPTHDFLDTLKEELNIDSEAAKSIAAEIKDKILEPIRKELYDWGVDISLIHVVDAKPFDELFPELEEAEEKSPEVRVPFVEPAPEPEEEVLEAPVPEVKPKPAEEGKPLVIHTEKRRAPEEKVRGFKGFGRLGFIKPGAKEGEREKPLVRAEIETPVKKTVHYSEHRTPLDSFRFEVPTADAGQKTDQRESAKNQRPPAPDLPAASRATQAGPPRRVGKSAVDKEEMIDIQKIGEAD